MIQRKNAFNLTANEQNAYKDAVTAMIADPGATGFGALARIHSDMSHMMHTMTGGRADKGTWRFLSWHRAYLIHMEESLIAHAAPQKKTITFIPYWKWEDGGVPSWLASFKPTVNGITNNRNNITTPFTSNDSGGLTIAARFPVLMQQDDYYEFSHGLEVFPHNRGHIVLGVPMKDVPNAPDDPIFYMHHAEVDRWWALWQAKFPGRKPILTGLDAKMDPWNDTVDSLSDISKLPAASAYTYV
jgi:hypothetical protein